ncbi:threonine--tRNA ligase [Halobacillus salinarum]|uniref:Threonine--tRNA ligase n=1 Tax=Halobacillus salinarum TaxID=2932257 RepID=A0ABY4EPN0_9BACI|nr:threonine--tRNA ligase [Halobacillus salinarum]UOQ45950.1 threonine--tRNA ligase [Halobacillus salinarum]
MEKEKIIVQFPNGAERKYPKGVALEEIAESISPSLKKKSVAGEVNGKLYDMKQTISSNVFIELVDLQSNSGLEVMRHTAAHILAQAVRRIFGKVNLGVGPVIENGFYYDMELGQKLSISDLHTIEKEMRKIISENLEIRREEISREEARILFQADPYKLELLEDIPVGEKISIYRQGEFVDLCRGPHLPSTGLVQAFKLTQVSGAYWRGDSSNQMLQRIYGAAFPNKEELKEYFHFLEEAEKRNHRKLGKELELFMFSEEAPGMPFYLPNGQVIRNELEAYLRKLQESYGYQEVRTPVMMNQRLWEQSGHWEHYKENMYFSEVDEQRFAIKPMNCPGHMLIFKNKLHSYRDLPVRMAEFGQVHRHEFSGALNGLLRVRTFCQDDAHIYVTAAQIEQEVSTALKLIDDVYQTFGFSYEVELSTRPEKRMGEEKLWDEAEAALKNVLHDLNYHYRINEGDGAFYGPKIDIHIKDALKRSHQCATVQLDFQMPEKFDLSYIDEHGEKVRPVVIHRAVFGSIDRFLGILIEHFAGAFPSWLAPVQAKLIPVSNTAHMDYMEKLLAELKQAGIRAELDSREEKLGYKIRDAQKRKVPFILIAGDQEISSQTINVRRYGSEGSTETSFEKFIHFLKESIDNRSLVK